MVRVRRSWKGKVRDDVKINSGESGNADEMLPYSPAMSTTETASASNADRRASTSC